MTRRGTSGALLLGGIAAGWLLAEALLWALHIEYPVFRFADPDLGYTLRPGIHGWYRQEGTAYIRINSHGFRDREHDVAKPAGAVRIAVLGDSYAEALQVPQDKTFWAVLEQQLAHCPALRGRPVEVLNFGVSGYSTAQELVMLRTRVWAYAPDVVLLAFYAGNDVLENSRTLSNRASAPYFVLTEGRLEPDNSFRTAPPSPGYKAPSLWFSLVDHSRVLQLVQETRDQSVKREHKKMLQARQREVMGEEGPAGPAAMVFQTPPPPAWEEAWRVTEALVHVMAQDVRTQGARFGVVMLTTPQQVDPKPAHRAKVLRKQGIADFYYPERRLSALGARDGFPVLTLAPEMAEEALRTHVYFHGFPNTEKGEGHWNEAGHRAGGERMARWVCESGLLQ